MTTFNKKILAAAMAAAFGFGAAGNAYAGASAFSSLIISDFQMFNAGTGNQVSITDFAAVTAADTLTVSANLNGVGETRAASRSIPPVPLGTADTALACVGPDCNLVGANDFTQQNAAGLPANPLQFARADARLAGAIITGTDQPAAALGEQVSEVQLNQSGVGAADSRITNSSEFTFTIDQAMALRFDFFADAVLDVLLNQPDVDASAGRSFSITIIQNGTEVFNWVPNLGVGGTPGGTQNAAAFNLNTSINIQSEGRTGPLVNSGFFQATSEVLQAGTYNLTILGTTSANAEAIVPIVPPPIPEPATLGLFGAGLLGMGAMYRRRSKAKA